MPDAVTLISALDAENRKLNTQSLDLSFNELLDMHASGELNIEPEYQRLFRWSDAKQSRFIESLLLEMPVPPIYVVEEEDGKYVLIDGLQRISSYLHLRGKLAATHLTPPILMGEMLKLVDCDIVPALNGLTYDGLGTALQIRLKRAFVRVEVIRKGSDPRFKYHMFKRLNTGGVLLTEQQIRNCTIRLLDPRFNNFLIELSRKESFSRCVEALTDEAKLGAADQELVLRFFALKNWRDHFSHEVGDFLTEYMEGVTTGDVPFEYESERDKFEKTFALLAETLGDNSFSYSNKKRSALVGGFSVLHFEALTIGLQAYLDRIDLSDKSALDKVKALLNSIKLDGDFISLTTGGGKNSAGQLDKRIAFVSDKFSAKL
jgi:hypothetical protein